MGHIDHAAHLFLLLSLLTCNDSSCTDVQQAKIESARLKTHEYLKTLHLPLTESSPYFWKWFGNPDLNHNDYRNLAFSRKFELIESSQKLISVDCSCTDIHFLKAELFFNNQVDAYVTPELNKITFCPGFFTAPGLELQALTVFHELSHVPILFGTYRRTTDYAYSFEKCMKLAAAKRRRNAANFEYFLAEENGLALDKVYDPTAVWKEKLKGIIKSISFGAITLRR